MKLYWGPNTCAIEIAALLEEAGVAYTDERVDTQVGAQHEAPFRSVNPKGKFPVLVRDDGTTITEFPTIARWIARTHPGANLIPLDADIEMKASEMMDYTVGTLHGQAFRRMFFPQEFCKDEAHRSDVKADGRGMAKDGFDVLSQQLGDRPFAAGEHFSIADAAIFYTTRWAKLVKLELPANIAALSDRVRSRPAFEKVLARMT